MSHNTPVYPFTAIVGQDDMKCAILANIINPGIGGVLIKGEKGTAKSTAVRAAAELLPEKKVIKGCPFHCKADQTLDLCPECRKLLDSGAKPACEYAKMRVVELPLSATEDRVSGTLDLEHAITAGKKQFEPGVLAAANGNILYVDEINLLDDHIIDLLLDAAAMGVNFVERDGISYMHPSRFLLIGTMNPEEGDLRPQLLDRFGLSVHVTGEKQPGVRTEIIRRRLAFEKDPEGFCREYEPLQEDLRRQILSAQELVREIEPDEQLLETAVRISLFLEVDGHRADLTLVKTAVARAALKGRTRVNGSDILAAVRLVMPHRMRKLPFEESRLDMAAVEALIQECYPN